MRVPHGCDDVESEVAAEFDHRLTQLDAIHTPLLEYLFQQQRLKAGVQLLLHVLKQDRKAKLDGVLQRAQVVGGR